MASTYKRTTILKSKKKIDEYIHQLFFILTYLSECLRYFANS